MSRKNSESTQRGTDDKPIDVGRASITEIPRIGGVRAHRLGRDLGIDTIRGVAVASIDELTQVWSIGELTAMRIKGSAQGLVNAWKESLEEARETVRPDMEKDADWVGRVAVLFGDVADDDGNIPVKPQVCRKLVRDALNHADIEIDSDTEVGFVGGWKHSDEFGEAGGRVVSEYLDWTATTGSPASRREFPTPWTKYAHFCDFGYEPDGEMPSVSTIPFDTPRGVEDVEAWMAPAERTRKMVEWADEVVIPLDGEYTDAIRREAERHNTPCTTFMELDRANDLRPYSPTKKPEKRTVDEEEIYVGPEREGSPDDLDPDEPLEIGVTTRDEHRQTDDETAGGGVGSGSDRKGIWDDRFIA